MVLIDPARNDYEIPLLIRYPIEASGRRPVVIFNHGGGPSPNARERAARWGETFAAAGYVVIHPARTRPANLGDFADECAANGQTTVADCVMWIASYRFGPSTTHFLIDRLKQLDDAYPEFRLDVARTVVAGYSAGSVVPLANAGARQQWVDHGTVYRERDARPIAFIGIAPAGPSYAGFASGFQSGSYARIDGRPFLFVTGVGDTTNTEKPSESRSAGWLLSRAGGKYLSWDQKRQVTHETLGLEQCDTDLQAAHCDWMASLGVAFLDAVARKRKAAAGWLASDAYAIATGGEIELHRR
jgi:hypothetical protein